MFTEFFSMLKNVLTVNKMLTLETLSVKVESPYRKAFNDTCIFLHHIFKKSAMQGPVYALLLENKIAC